MKTLDNCSYESEIEDGYNSFEEEFWAEERLKEFRVSCENCGKQFVLEAEYQGIVDIEQRDMGPESLHEWSADDKCPSCGERVELTYEYWEYPPYMFNYEDTTCDGCKIVPGKVDKSQTILAKFFRDSASLAS